MICAAVRIVKRGPSWYAETHEHTSSTHPESRGRRVRTSGRAEHGTSVNRRTAPNIGPARGTRPLGPAPRRTHHGQRLLADWRGLLAERAEERGLLAGLATDRHGRRAHLQLLGHELSEFHFVGIGKGQSKLAKVLKAATERLSHRENPEHEIGVCRL